MRNLSKVMGAFLLLFVLATAAEAAPLNVERLSDKDIIKVRELIRKLSPLILEREKQGDLARLTFEELYAPLSKGQQAFLKSFQDLDGKKLGIKIPYRGLATGQETLVAVKGQAVRVHDKEGLQALPVQFVSPDVYKSYTAMMEAMNKDLGKQLYIESAYRSSAYQLYLFVYYLSNHAYSIQETARFVALPGFSEHGWPQHQALDFINEDGISGEYHAEEFQNLLEYDWLMKNADQFGFVLSYPKDSSSGITFEPWHWRWGG
ncbi:MAG: M15 family metallopeptidase [Candidatus Omnitrophica bacterium]|nr:M15 family metallopeptidase [Candidatus Omnitrophota bacterium]